VRCVGLSICVLCVNCWVMGARKQVARKVGKGIGW
jgi:hypothetical protein